MANSLLTPSIITKESLMILHQKLRFIKNINRTYDDQYAKDGAKIGADLKIRLPNKYTVRTGSVMATQDVTEQSTTLTVGTMKGVDMAFNTTDLTLTIDKFADRYIKPAMSALAAAIEADALSMIDDVYQQAGTPGSALKYSDILTANMRLSDSLAPDDGRQALLCLQNDLDAVDTLKTLFNPSKEISDQYKEGHMGTAAGLDFTRTTHLGRHTSGSDASAYTVNGANQTGANLLVTTGTGTFKDGDIVTLAGCFRVHPETKVNTGRLQQFVITTDVAANATTIPISPSIVITGALQNVSAAPTTTGAVTKIGGASVAYDQSLYFHPDAFAFASADLVMPDGVPWKARENFEGISMRMIKQYGIVDDRELTRIDVLYGFKTIRPELASKTTTN